MQKVPTEKLAKALKRVLPKEAFILIWQHVMQQQLWWLQSPEESRGTLKLKNVITTRISFLLYLYFLISLKINLHGETIERVFSKIILKVWH